LKFILGGDRFSDEKSPKTDVFTVYVKIQVYFKMKPERR
jgi:hypothetical protein